MAAEKVHVIRIGSGGPTDGGKQGSLSVEFVAGDGGNKCSINDAGQELSLAELKDPYFGPNSTGFTARQTENVGQSPEIMGRSLASFKGGLDQVDRELLWFWRYPAISAMTSMKKHQDKSAFTGMTILYLNRHQIEEWKGWAKVTFLCCSVGYDGPPCCAVWCVNDGG
ncbi:hypothetical protein Ancab_014266 [Ancistrocladus abbreviatus]